ncbi:ligand-binding sensor domain-containing diguanylate cyclase [Edaphobacter albus]|uniref:ligand-binding sensor domain-containing diguanylate cyclase n=1 Tax=Edaphobacter sp. 4G125 TaxID=2763071 RepID=UPI00164772BC|nr:ligand-binding sensor domain-containing diguanylate cyclase [Edaphobacter sp. 4G125]QNI36787.1 diguanylate cyclase [Edaphobacter sp. 4G125]
MSRQPERNSTLWFPEFRRLGWLFLRLAVMLFCVSPGTTTTFAQQFNFFHYGQEQGLRNLDVLDLIEDNSGLLWIATENGLYRYDGAQFHRFGPEEGLMESLILGLHKDVSGRIWAASDDHIYFFDGKRFTAAPAEGPPLRLLPGEPIRSIDPDHILFLESGSLMLLSRSEDKTGRPSWKLQPFFTAAEISAKTALAHLHSLLISADGLNLWLGCGQALCRIRNPLGGDSRQIEVFANTQNIPSDDWVSLFEDRNETLWARSSQHIRILARSDSTFRTRDLPSVNGANAYQDFGILTMAEDQQGRVLTQANRGLARWEGSSWKIFDSHNGIDFKDVSAILANRSGIPWFGTRGHGIVRWQGYGEVENWTIAQGLHDDVVHSIFRDSQHRLWIADQFQVEQMNDLAGRFDVPRLFEEKPLLHGINFAESPDHSLWFFTKDGEVYRTDPALERIVFSEKLPPLASTFTDSSHRIWVLSQKGLYVIRRPDTPSIDKIADPLMASSAWADAAESPDHSLWFLGAQSLYRFTPSDRRFSRIPLDIASSFQMRNIAAAPDGTLWIGGTAGLLHLQIDGDHVTVLDSISKPRIASSDVQFVRLDTRGWLWVGSSAGVNVFDGSRWRLLTRQDGLVSTDTNQSAFLAESDGSVWIGANGGAIHLLHPEHLLSPSLLDVRFTSATLGDIALSQYETPELPWKNASFNVHFTSLNFARDGSIRFRYRLVGRESRWRETKDHRLHYSGIAPGNYRFELQAIDLDRQKQSSVISLTFIVQPPWWQTPAVYIMLFVFILLALVLVWQWRERHHLQRQHLLGQMVAQRTQELETEKAELMAAREILSQQATRDALTGIWNRSAIIDILVREMDRARRTSAPLAVVLADIDHFKQVNDTMGHLAGDSILRDAARRMFHNIRPYDFIGRYGGEEFLLVLPGLPYRDPNERLNQILQSISHEPFLFEGRTVPVTSSFGVAWLAAEISDVEDFIRRADEALYRAKSSGRNRVTFHEESPPNNKPVS